MITWTKSWQGHHATVNGHRVLVQRVVLGTRSGFDSYGYRVLVDGNDVPCARRVNLSEAKFHAAAHAAGNKCKACGQGYAS